MVMIVLLNVKLNILLLFNHINIIQIFQNSVVISMFIHLHLNQKNINHLELSICHV